MSDVTLIYQKKIYFVKLDDGETYECIKTYDQGNEVYKIKSEKVKVTDGAIRLVKMAVQQEENRSG